MTAQLMDKDQIFEALLADYANGLLSRPLEILMETHLAMNPDSARAARMMMQIGGWILENSEPVSMSEGSWQNLLDMIAEEEEESYPAAAHQQQVAAQDNMPGFPRPLADYMPALDSPDGWRRIGLGLQECKLDFGLASGQATIYRIAPGSGVPSHSHDGNEVTLVLAGGFTDENGTYGPGDIAIQASGTEHRPIADDDGECIVFAVNEGSIQLTGPIGRVLNLLVN
jgi:putative transcriptional regulator